MPTGCQLLWLRLVLNSRFPGIGGQAMTTLPPDTRIVSGDPDSTSSMKCSNCAYNSGPGPGVYGVIWMPTCKGWPAKSGKAPLPENATLPGVACHGAVFAALS